MANKHAGEIAYKVEPDGKEYVFRLGLNEMVSLQEKLAIGDDDLDKFFAALVSKRTLKTLRLICHHMLLAKQPDITEVEAGELLTQIGVTEFNSSIVPEVLKWALPEKREVTATAAKGKEGASGSPGTPS